MAESGWEYVAYQFQCLCLQHAGEVYGEKAVLATESQELQRRLIQLRAEKDKAFAAVSEVCGLLV